MDTDRYVLVVEDDQPVRQLVRVLLEDMNVAVREAQDGAEALDIMARQAPALVVVDLAMPRLDGESFIDEVRRRFERPAPVLLLSGAPARHLDDLARALSVVAVPKPFELDVLESRIRELLGLVPASVTAA